MNVVSLLNQLAQKDIRLWLENGQLRYNAPEGAMTPEVIAQLRTAKTAIIEFLQQSEKQDNDIPLANYHQALPVSSAQQRFWLVQQLDPSSSALHIHTALKIEGTIQPRLLQQACQAIISKHAILRSRYYQENGILYQAIEEESGWQLSVISTDTQQLASLIEQEKQQTFDLTLAQPFRCTLFQLSDEQYVLSFTIHHIAADGWSLGLFVQELITYYQQLAQQQPVTVQKLERQYADFASWQRSEARQEQLNQQLNYWLDQLTGVSNLDLPTKAARTLNTDSHAKSHHWQIPAHNLQTINKRYQGTAFTSCMALFSILLQRYSKQDDFCIGTPVAGRSAASVLEPIIGCFINVLAIRCELDSEQSVDDYFQAVKASCDTALNHQDVPFEQIVQKLQLKPDLSTTPIFQAMLTVQNAPFAFQPLPHLHISEYEDAEAQAQYDIMLSVREDGDNLHLALQYKTALFDQAFITRMADHFNYLLQEAAQQPTALLAELHLSAEQTQLSAQLQGSYHDIGSLNLLPQQFKHFVQSQPDSIAIAYQQQKLSYGELGQQVELLSKHLLNQGVKPGDFVGICLHREPQLIASILAVLSIGAAYVPLDPALPAARLQYILSDSQAVISITRSRFADLLPPAHSLINLDALADDAAYNTVLNAHDTQASDLAYLLYTSGSTGEPKGVMIEHTGLANYLDYASKQYFQEAIGGVVSSSINFDATITTLLAPLYCGKQVILTDSGDDDLNELAAHIFNNENNLVFKITPAHLEFLRHKHSNKQTLKEHFFIIGGEQLLVSQSKPWLERLTPKATWVNEYGPTETVVGCSIYFLQQQDLPQLQHSAVPIGKPIQNTDLLILDENGRVSPAGIPGELYIASTGVAKGYLNLEQQTQEVFTAYEHPHYSRLYRTGDIVRLLDNGELLYLGRSDHQVKIRGQRIELSEIEACLANLESIHSAVVDVREHHGDKRLVAWYQSAAPIEQPALTQHLAKHLPQYMLPSQFIAVDKWPLTSNGKINRNKLPEPDWQDSNCEEYIAPTTATEKALVTIWQKVLQLDKIGINDNFFTIGGHSLTAAQALALAQQEFNIELPLRQLFENPTIAAIAQQLDDALLAQKVLAQHQDSEAESEELESFVL